MALLKHQSAWVRREMRRLELNWSDIQRVKDRFNVSSRMALLIIEEERQGAMMVIEENMRDLLNPF